MFESSAPIGRLLGTSRKAEELREAVRLLPPSRLSVVLEGEAGTGKLFTAELMHELGPCPGGPLVVEDCRFLSESNAAEILLGMADGRRRADRRGIAERAMGGTLFLAEIQELPLKLQPCLQRILDDRAWSGKGTARSRRKRFRLVTSVTGRLLDIASEGIISRGLYDRIFEERILLPALRERREDIPILTDHFTMEAGRNGEIDPPILAEQARRQLRDYSWPGNLRELRNVIERLTRTHQGKRVDVISFLPGHFDSEGSKLAWGGSS